MDDRPGSGSSDSDPDPRSVRGLAARSLLLVLLLALVATAPTILADSKPPAAAPDFTLPTSSGKISLSDLRGKVVYVDFWASWCAPCRQSFPWMKQLSEQYGDKGLVVLAINLDKKREAVHAFLEEFPVKFDVAFDPEGSTAEAFHVQAMPSSFIVGRNGEIVHAHAGFDPAKTKDIEDQIKEALSR